MNPVPRFVTVRRVGDRDIPYAWNPGSDRPHVAGEHYSDRVVAAYRSHAKALGLFGVFGATLAHSAYFQDTSGKGWTLAFLDAAYTCFLATICFSICLQLIPRSQSNAAVCRIVLAMSGAGGAFLSFAISLAPKLHLVPGALLMVCQVSVFVGVPLFLHRQIEARGREILPGGLKSFLDALSEYPEDRTHASPASQQQHSPSHQMEIEMHPSGGHDEAEFQAAAFFIVSYSWHGGALTFLKNKTPAFSTATIEDHFMLYDAVLPSGEWRATDGSNTRTLARKFLELAERWGSLIEELEFLLPGFLHPEPFLPDFLLPERRRRFNRAPRTASAHLLLALEQIHKFGSAVPSSASPLSSENDRDYTISSRPYTTRVGDNVTEDDAAALTPSTGGSEEAPRPSDSLDRPARASSGIPGLHAPAHSPYAAEPAMGIRKRSTAASGPMLGGEVGSQGIPRSLDVRGDEGVAGSQEPTSPRAGGHCAISASEEDPNGLGVNGAGAGEERTIIVPVRPDGVLHRATAEETVSGAHQRALAQLEDSTAETNSEEHRDAHLPPSGEAVVRNYRASSSQHV